MTTNKKGGFFFNFSQKNNNKGLSESKKSKINAEINKMCKKHKGEMRFGSFGSMCQNDKGDKFIKELTKKYGRKSYTKKGVNYNHIYNRVQKSKSK